MNLKAAVEKHLAAAVDRRDARAEAKALYQLLLQPVALLGQSTRVVIIPDGKLHLVAFDALVDPNDRYVVETHVISYAPSATVYYLLSRPMPSQPTSDGVVGGGRRSLFTSQDSETFVQRYVGSDSSIHPAHRGGRPFHNR